MIEKLFSVAVNFSKIESFIWSNSEVNYHSAVEVTILINTSINNIFYSKQTKRSISKV